MVYILTFFITSIIGYAFYIYEAKRIEKKDAKFWSEMKLMDEQINYNFERIKTANEFLKLGYRPIPSNEHIISIENGYLISRDEKGKENIVLAPNNKRH